MQNLFAGDQGQNSSFGPRMTLPVWPGAILLVKMLFIQTSVGDPGLANPSALLINFFAPVCEMLQQHYSYLQIVMNFSPAPSAESIAQGQTMIHSTCPEMWGPGGYDLMCNSDWCVWFPAMFCQTLFLTWDCYIWFIAHVKMHYISQKEAIPQDLHSSLILVALGNHSTQSIFSIHSPK